MARRGRHHRAANSVEYGLTAAVWTNDIKRALKTARAWQSGMVWVNASDHFKGLPYGGYKTRASARKAAYGAVDVYRGKVDPDFFERIYPLSASPLVVRPQG